MFSISIKKTVKISYVLFYCLKITTVNCLHFKKHYVFDIHDIFKNMHILYLILDFILDSFFHLEIFMITVFLEK